MYSEPGGSDIVVLFESPAVESVVVESHHQVSRVLFDFDVFAKLEEEVFEVVVEVLLESLHHGVVVVLLDALPDVLGFKQDALLPPGNGIHKMGVSLRDDSGCLTQNSQVVVVFSEEVVNEVLISSLFELTGGGAEEPDNDPTEEVGPQVDVVDDAVDSLRSQQTLLQADVEELVVLTDDLVDGLDFAEFLDELVEVGL